MAEFIASLSALRPFWQLFLAVILVIGVITHILCHSFKVRLHVMVFNVCGIVSALEIWQLIAFEKVEIHQLLSTTITLFVVYFALGINGYTGAPKSLPKATAEVEFFVNLAFVAIFLVFALFIYTAV